MNTSINHIKYLIHFAYADGLLHEKELDYIRLVGERMGLKKEEIENEIENKSTITPPLPKNEVLRFILFEDILHIIVADLKITEDEIVECKRVAKHLGFEEEMVDALMDKMKEHVKNGFINNTKVEFLESEMYNLTLNKLDNEKYH